MGEGVEIIVSDEQQPKESISNRQLTERGIGVLALIGGAVLTYLSVISPLLAASRHEETVSLSLKGAVITPLVLAIGIINILMGDKASKILGRRQKPSALGWAIYLIMVGVGILLYQWLKSRLRNYGYQI